MTTAHPSSVFGQLPDYQQFTLHISLPIQTPSLISSRQTLGASTHELLFLANFLTSNSRGTQTNTEDVHFTLCILSPCYVLHVTMERVPTKEKHSLTADIKEKNLQLNTGAKDSRHQEGITARRNSPPLSSPIFDSASPQNTLSSATSEPQALPGLPSVINADTSDARSEPDDDVMADDDGLTPTPEPKVTPSHESTDTSEVCERFDSCNLFSEPSHLTIFVQDNPDFWIPKPPKATCSFTTSTTTS